MSLVAFYFAVSYMYLVTLINSVLYSIYTYEFYLPLLETIHSNSQFDRTYVVESKSKTVILIGGKSAHDRSLM